MPKPSKTKEPLKAKVRVAKTERAGTSTTNATISKPSTKLETLVAALKAPAGASISDMMELTGWQAHSVRGALSGALKKQRGLAITSNVKNGERIYKIGGRA